MKDYIFFSNIAATWRKTANEATNKYDKAVAIAYYKYYANKAHNSLQ